MNVLIFSGSLELEHQIIQELNSALLELDYLIVRKKSEFSSALLTQPGLVIFGESLPEIDLLSAVDAVKKQHESVPVLVIDHGRDPDKMIQCFRLGVSDYLLENEVSLLPHIVKKILAKVDQEKGKIRKTAQVDKMTAQARAIYQFYSKMLVVKSNKEMSEVTLDALQSLVGFDWAAVLMTGRKADNFNIWASHSEIETALEAKSVWKFTPEVLTKLRNGHVIQYDDSYLAQSKDGLTYYLRELGFESIMLVPVLDDKDLIGLLALSSVQPGKYLELHATYAQRVAMSVALGLHQIKLREVERKNIVSSRALYKASYAVTSNLNIHQVLDTVLEQIILVTNADAANLMIFQGEMVDFMRHKGYENFEDVIQSFMDYRKFELLPSWRRVMGGEVVYFPDISQQNNWFTFESLEWIRSWIGVPIYQNGKVLGVLNIDSSEPNAFDDVEVDFISVFANQLSIAIQNSNLYQQAQDQLDELTQTEATLNFQYQFEKLITAISSKFINIRPDVIDDEINDVMKMLGEFLSLESCAVLQNKDDSKDGTYAVTYQWNRIGVGDFPQKENLYKFPGIWKNLMYMETVQFPNINRVPDEMIQERLKEIGVQSLILIPFFYAGTRIGILRLVNIGSQLIWTDESISLLGIVAEIIGNTLTNMNAESLIKHYSEFERFTTETSTRFISTPISKVNEEVNEAIHKLGDLIGANLVTVYQLVEGGKLGVNIATWQLQDQFKNFYRYNEFHMSQFPWLAEKVYSGKVIHVPHHDVLPPIAKAFKKLIIDQNLHSVVIVPMRGAGKIYGFIGLNKEKESIPWQLETVNRLTIFGEILGNLLYRQEISQEIDKLVSAVNQTPVGIVITNLHGEVEYVNDAFRHIGRIKAGIQPGVLFTDVVGEDSQFYKNLRDVLMMSGVSRREFKYVTAADEVWVDLSVNPIKDEKGLIRSYLITVTDITERKRIEAAASKNRHRYDALFNSSNDGVFILDLSGNIQEVNQKGAELLGYTTSELVGKHSEMLNLSFTILDTRRTEEDTFPRNLPILQRKLTAKDGTRIPVEISVSLVRDDQGNPVNYQHIARDIRERQRVEDQLKSQAQELQIMNDVNAALNEGADLHDVVKVFSSEIQVAFSKYQTPGVATFLLNEYQDAFVMRNYLKESNVIQAIENLLGDAVPLSTIIPVEVLESEGLVSKKAPSILDTEEKIEDWFKMIVANNWVFSNVPIKEKLPSFIRKRFGLEVYYKFPLYLNQKLKGIILIGVREKLPKFEYERLERLVAQMEGAILRKMAEDDLKSSEQRYRSLVGSAPEGILILDYDSFEIMELNKRAEDIFGIGADEISNYTVMQLSPKMQPNGRLSEDYGRELLQLAKDQSPIEYEWMHVAQNGREIPCEIRVGVFEERGRNYFIISITDISQRKETEKQLLESQELFRSLARDLHDAVVQTLFSQLLRIETAKILVKKDPEMSLMQLDAIEDLANAALSELRALLYQLRPRTIQENGLVPALSQYIDAVEKREEIKCELQVDASEQILGDYAVALFRIAQEGINNVLKHAETDKVSIKISYRDRLVEMVIEDAGVGYDLNALSKSEGMGLQIMRERVEMLKGDMQINSTPGKGTKIKVSIPYQGGESG